MVGRWGMSPAVSPVSVLPDPRSEQPLGDGGSASPATRELVDHEVRRILDDCYTQARATLEDDHEASERLTQALLAAEKLDVEQAYAAAGVPHRALVPAS